MHGAAGRLGAWLGATWRIWAPLAAALATLAAGAVAWIGGQADVADAIWGVGVAIVLVPLTVGVVRDLVRGDVGVDLIALAAMVGALAIGEYLAGVVIAIMLAGGNALEAAAGHRARRELTRLIQRAPRTALVRSADGIVEVPVDAVVPGDVVVVRAGEISPVDGIVIGGRAVIDESALTGEALPVVIEPAGEVRSGAANAGDSFELRAQRPAAESAYAAIVRLVQAAETQRAPFVRMADRFAVWMLPFTAVVAGAAWAISGRPGPRGRGSRRRDALPAHLGGAHRADLGRRARRARRGHRQRRRRHRAAGPRPHRALRQDRHAHARRRLDRARRTHRWDRRKTPCWRWRPRSSSTRCTSRPPRWCGQRGSAAWHYSTATDVIETPGSGVRGRVAGAVVAVGASHNGPTVDAEPGPPGQMVIGVWIDDALAGELVMSDPVRPDAAGLVDRLRRAGVRRIAMVSGDRREIADADRRSHSVSMRRTPSRHPRTNSAWSAGSAVPATSPRWSWSGMASTMHQPLRSPIAGSPWAPQVPRSPPRPRTR